MTATMPEDHVPSVGLRYWALFLAASAFSSISGDMIADHPLFGLVGDVLVLLGVLGAVLVCERYDPSPTDIWYWMAVIVTQVEVEMLVEHAIHALALNRGAVLAGVAALLAFILVGARSSATVIISAQMISRPGIAAKPMNDTTQWIVMVVASTLGTVAGDYLTVGLGAGVFSSFVVLVVLMIFVLCLWLLPWANRLFVYWLTIAAVCTAGTILGAFLSKAPMKLIGLPLGIVLTSALVAFLLLLWRPSRPC